MKKNDSAKQHIVIVGGGMVGLSLAVLIAQQKDPGLAITLIEQHGLPSKDSDAALQQPSFDARSTALSAASLDIFRSMNCLASLKPYLQTIETIHVSDKGHMGGTQLAAKDYDLDGLGYVIENRHLGNILLKQLAQYDIDCKMSTKVTHCQPVKKGYELSLASGTKTSHLRADLLIVADGAQSPLRQHLGVSHSSHDYHQVAMVANVSLSQAHQSKAYERFTHQGPMALLPLPANSETPHRAALIWTLPETEQETYKAADEKMIIEQFHKQFGFRAGRVIGLGKRDFYPLTLIQAEEQVRTGLVILGNAAHFLHPVAGQGFNLALRDCQALNRILKKARLGDDSAENTDNTTSDYIGTYSILEQYQQLQASDQQLTVNITDQLVKRFSTDHIGPSLLRQLGLLALNRLPYVKNQFANIMMGQSL